MAKLIIRRQQQQAQYYTEELGSDFALDMMLIPGGTFMMGTPEQEIERLCKEYDEEYFRWESPQHEVTVPSFFMGKYPITQAQWKAIASLPKVDIDLDSDPSSFKDPYEGQDRWTRPVEQVSWDDAAEFCKRLSRETKRDYRLPTEAEWEYGCRAGTKTPFHFGETITTDLANYRGTDREIDKKVYPGNYGKGPKGIYRQETTPVGYFKAANAFGLYDMHGNVWEWCADSWHKSYAEKPKELKDDGSIIWLDSNITNYVLRGGSWLINPNNCRSAYRTFNPRGNYYNDVSFRVVRSSPRTL